MMRYHVGMSLVEVILAMSIVGILATLTAPQFLKNISTDSGPDLGRVEQMMQQIRKSIDLCTEETGQPVSKCIDPNNRDPNNIDMQSILMGYSNYFILKKNAVSQSVDSGGPIAEPSGPPTGWVFYDYFLMPDGSRLTTNPTVFMNANFYPPTKPAGSTKLIASPINQKMNGWATAATNAPGLCGTYPGHRKPNLTETRESRSQLNSYKWNQCLYLDVNGGETGPNDIGPGGDIIIFRVDPDSLTIRTLYQAMLDDGFTDCRDNPYYSAYDAKMGVVRCGR